MATITIITEYVGFEFNPIDPVLVCLNKTKDDGIISLDSTAFGSSMLVERVIVFLANYPFKRLLVDATWHHWSPSMANRLIQLLESLPMDSNVSVYATPAFQDHLLEHFN